MLTTCTPSFNVDKTREVKVSRERHSVFFTAVNPVYTYQNQEEVQYDLVEPRVAENKNTWPLHPNYSILVQFEACSEERSAVLSTTI